MFVALRHSLLVFAIAGSACAADKVNVAPATPVSALWNEVDPSGLNLFYGSGGKAHEPKGPFKFVKEDLDGTNPKFVVKDEEGVKWKVKLGVEAKPETAATRLVWAAGYHTNEDYFLPTIQVKDLPAKLKRGQSLRQPDGSFRDVRLKREDGKKEGEWKWRDNPFSGTRELDGLRAMMAVINNWDLKDVNNAVYDNGKIFLVSDLGASFGTTNLLKDHAKAKGNIQSYEKSKFIVKTTPAYVSFSMPTRPSFVFIFNPREYFSRINMEWIGKRIPRDDVKWMGRILARLSPEQLRDAFRAAGYSPDEAAAFAGVVSKRIGQLSAL